MIRYTPGYAPVANAGDTVPTAPAKSGAAVPTLPTVERAKALAASRAAQVLDYSRQKGAKEALVHNLRTDGPTLEKWVEAGYLPENYPPDGYAELDSPALTAYKAKVAADLKSGPPPKPHSVNDHPEVEK